MSFPRSFSARRSRGFTLTEILIAMVIIALIVFFGLPQLAGTVGVARTQNAADALGQAAATARARALQNGVPTALVVNAVSTQCGTAPVAWAIEQNGTAVMCVSAADFASRYGGVNMSSNFTRVVYAPTGLANNTFNGLAQFSAANASSTAQVTVYIGGSATVTSSSSI